MATAHVAIMLGPSNENGDGMTVAGLPSSYQGHDLTSLGDAVYSQKIWNNTSAFQNLSQSTSLTGNTYLGLGPQLFLAAEMLNSGLTSGDIYIFKYCVGVTGLNAHATANNWSAEDWVETRSMLRLASLQLAAMSKNLLANGYDTVAYRFISTTFGATDSIYGLWAYNFEGNVRNMFARLFEFMGWADGAGPYIVWNQDAVPRDTPSSGTAITCYAEYGELIRQAGVRAITSLQSIHGTYRAGFNSTSANYASGDLASDGLHWTSPGMQKKTLSGYALVTAAFSNGYTAPTITRGAVTTAAQTGATLTVASVSSGTIVAGQLVYANGVSIGTISAFGTGGTTGTGGAGTYNVSASSTYASTTVTLINWVEDTTFDTLPTISTTTPPAATYAVSAAVTATVTANNFDAGHTIGNATWSCDDDAAFTATGGSLSCVPAVYNGLCVRVKYENAKHYVAHNYYWTHVLAPRTLTGFGTPKHWIREGIGHALIAGSTSHTLNIVTTSNASGADATIDWTPLTGTPKGHHRGVAMMASDCVRAQLISDDTTTAASISPAADFTLLIKFRVRTVQNGDNLLYGSRSTSTNSAHIGLVAQTTNNQTDVIPLLARGTTTVVDTGVDVANAGDFAGVVYRRSGNLHSMHYWNGSGVTKRTDVSNSSITTNAGASVIGWSGKVGVEGLVAEILGVTSAVSDANIAATITEVMAEGPAASVIKHLKNKMQMLGVGA